MGRLFPMLAIVLAMLAAVVPAGARGAALPPADGSAFTKEWMRPQGQAAPPARPPAGTQGPRAQAPRIQAPGAQNPDARAPRGEGTPAPASCPQPLRNGCEAQQASCRLACPPMWSTNPGAPAFTPTDRAGCTQQCFSRYLSCLNLYGCR